MAKAPNRAAVDKTKPRPAFSITSKRETFRRLGRLFQRNEATVIAIDEIDADEVARLEEEGELVFTPTEIAAEAPAGADKS